MEILLASILMALGIIGVIIPVLPGVPFMWLVALGYGLLTRFTTLHASELLILGVLALLSLGVDYAGGVLGARWGGASRQSLVFGIGGMLVGLVLFPPFGAIIGLALGVFVAELRTHQNHQRAGKAAIGSVAGTVGGSVINVILAFIFLALFVGFARS